MAKPNVVAQKVAIGVEANTVTVNLICSDNYAAQVLYDDLTERLSAGNGLKIHLAAGSSAALQECP